jgi:hypothetical protein
MAKSRTKRHIRRRSKKGGFGGWDRQTLVGAAWNPPANNTYAQLTSPGALSNHFNMSRNGMLVGGIQPAVPEMYGPGINQTNTLVPRLPIGALGSKGGRRRKQTLKRTRTSRHGKRGKKGGDGFIFGGFPQLIGTAWDNAVNGVKNTANAYNGVKLLPSASAWNQPELMQSNSPPLVPNTNAIAAVRQAVNQRAAIV